MMPTDTDADFTAYPVLVVEDDRAIRSTLIRFLHRKGYRVREAPDGELALRQLYVSPEPLVAVVDLWMPGMDGMALLRAVAPRKMLASRHAYILMTGTPRSRYTLPRDVSTILAQLRVPVLAKPFHTDELYQVVHQAQRRLERTV